MIEAMHYTDLLNMKKNGTKNIYLAYEINVYFYMLEIMDRVFLKCEILLKYTATGLQHFKVNTEVLKDFFRVTRVFRTGLYI